MLQITASVAFGLLIFPDILLVYVRRKSGLVDFSCVTCVLEAEGTAVGDFRMNMTQLL